MRVLIEILIFAVAIISTTNAAEGGSSISGIWVTCHDKMDVCVDKCESWFRQCYVADHCNEGSHQQAACAPNVASMVLLTFLCIASLVSCCCILCFCAPCCICYQALKKRKNRNRQNAKDAELIHTTKATAPEF
ncbi:unnamed protein product, partial [Mesorhabditis spiculigera]